MGWVSLHYTTGEKRVCGGGEAGVMIHCLLVLSGGELVPYTHWRIRVPPQVAGATYG